jgi:hypothetical protein
MGAVHDGDPNGDLIIARGIHRASFGRIDVDTITSHLSRKRAALKIYLHRSITKRSINYNILSMVTLASDSKHGKDFQMHCRDWSEPNTYAMLSEAKNWRGCRHGEMRLHPRAFVSSASAPH